MNNKTSRTKIILAAILVFAVTTTSCLIFSGGCTNTLDGELNANQKPIVYFVNIPPGPREVCDTVDGVITCDTIITQFSRNPVIHWVGTDRDGIIASFRYCVATVAEVGGLNPMTYAASIAEADWIQLDVDPKGPDPRTTNTVAMSADLTDPVRTFVDQYVFLQAFDELGLGSDITYRMFSRNDNPPTTGIWPWPGGRPSINSELPGGIVTGVGIKYSADDPIDYPSEPPPFEYQWRLYGPYDDSTLALIQSEYFTHVCPTADGQVYRIGEEIQQCDTIFTDSGTEIDCSVCTCEVDLIPPPEMAAYVSVEEYFDIDALDDSLIRFGDISYDGPLTNYVAGDCGEVDSVRQYKCEAQADPDTWLTGLGVDAWIPQNGNVSEQVLFNVFWNYHSDTTLQMNYIFWVRSRDDAMVPDLVPAFESFPVINPRYERDVLVLDLITPNPKMWVPVDDESFSPKMYWKGAIDAWAAATGRDSIVFDTAEVAEWVGKASSPDYMKVSRWSGAIPIAELLKHKVVILYNDCLALVPSTVFDNVYTSIDAGVSVWATWRTFLNKSRKNPPDLDIAPPFQFTWYFGVERTAWSGWACHTCEGGGDPCDPCGYYQDFIGAGSKYPEVWPYLPIDTGLLHNRYEWKSNTWEGTNGEGVGVRPGLPEVNWSQLMNGTTTIYKYKSSFGQSHPLGFNYAFQGRPVGHLYHTSLFKTAHFNFTPIAIQPDSMQKTVNVLMSWLYERDTRVPLALDAAPVQISLDDARANAKRRQEQLLMEMGLDQPGR